MKYKTEITEAFNRLGFTPWDNQIDAVNLVLTAFLDKGVKNVVLNASTGTGKSIIGAVCAEALHKIKKPGDAHKAGILLTATNVLADQYNSTFSRLKDEFLIIKGANNYPCTALTTSEEAATAEACAWAEMKKNEGEFEDILNSHCAPCEYSRIKYRKNKTRHVTTNYSYYFIDRLYTGIFEQRSLLVWDEAHLVNDLFSEHNAIYFSESRLKQDVKTISETLPLADMSIINSFLKLAADCAVEGRINDKNFEPYLRALHKLYVAVKELALSFAETALRSNEHKKYVRFNRLAKQYEGRGCKIDDFFNFNYDFVFEWKKEEKAVSVKPVFIGNMFNTLNVADHNLFMSGTINAEFAIQTLGLERDDVEFIKLPPSFPRENKEIVFFNPMSLNYQAMQDPATIKKLRTSVAKIVAKHIEEGERGIILTPSFVLTEAIVEEMKDLQKTLKFRIYDQRKGEKLADILSAFKAHKGIPAILISPALFEGVDLPGDLSRFQVLVKAPFPSLGDKRMKHILDKYKTIYELTTLMKIVQGAGRSVRGPTDYATTYILDTNAQRLFKSPMNVWADEFNIRYTNFI